MNIGATPVECIDTLRIVSFFAQQVPSPMQPILQSRIAAAQLTLTKLLDQSSKI
jgi:hypothetical protein